MSDKPTLSRVIKPTTNTPFHIDYEWWIAEDRNLRAYLITHLPSDVRETYADLSSDTLIDWVDPDTGEVKPVDGLIMRIRALAEQGIEFITDQTSIVDAVFRTFLLNNNKPLSARELGQQLHRDATLILRTISGQRVYKGLRPIIDRN